MWTRVESNSTESLERLARKRVTRIDSRSRSRDSHTSPVADRATSKCIPYRKTRKHPSPSPTCDELGSAVAASATTRAALETAECRCLAPLHHHEEVLVRLRLRHLVDEELHRFHGRHLVEDLPEDPDLVELFLHDEQLFLPGSRGLDVDRGEDAAIGELAIEVELHVARALELLEDHVIHPRAGIDERRRHDRERSALLDVPGGAEEALGPLERVRVDASG